MKSTFEKIIEDISRLNSLDTKTIPEKVLKFNEEFGEFSQELIKLLGFTHKPYDEEHFIEECADSLQVLLSIQLASCKLKNIQYDRVLDALLEKNKKWEAKSKEYTRDN
jgi:NTP pyrophosphatase (non-canonical NTP hydrolase)